MSRQAGSKKFACRFKRSMNVTTSKTAVSEHFGPGYGYIEAQALHGFLRHFRPEKIIEVGSGVSTFCMIHALVKNRKEKSTLSLLTFIKHNPYEIIQRIAVFRLLFKQV